LSFQPEEKEEGGGEGGGRGGRKREGIYRGKGVVKKGVKGEGRVL
jgi:hypothetical protein